VIELEPALRSLTENEVEFVVVGGVAISAHGSAYITQDLDLCYDRAISNLRKLARALEVFHPRLRDLEEGLPFIWENVTLRNGTNFTLITDIGSIDLLGEVKGVGTYSDLIENAITVTLWRMPIKIISLDELIVSKQAAGPTKDLLVLPELEALREIRDNPDIVK
jgi:predicted nucleotidyltransferase